MVGNLVYLTQFHSNDQKKMTGTLTPQEIESLLSENYVAYLACSDNNTPYIVPITYYYDQPTNSIIGYTTEGRKIQILRENPQVSLIVSEIDTLTEWKTVVLEGKFEEQSGRDQITAVQTLSTNLTKLISEKTQEPVLFINEVARIDGENDKVIYRIHLENKTGRYEVKDDKFE
jgi:nitroimidazol reductase NimA-like FMN-containing flavoprotein (pyridoxamine 5'-phosphate oxidase superfamily)